MNEGLEAGRTVAGLHEAHARGRPRPLDANGFGAIYVFDLGAVAEDVIEAAAEAGDATGDLSKGREE